MLAEAILPVIDRSQAPLARKPPSLCYDLREGPRQAYEDRQHHRQKQLFGLEMFGVILVRGVWFCLIEGMCV